MGGGGEEARKRGGSQWGRVFVGDVAYVSVEGDVSNVIYVSYVGDGSASRQHLHLILRQLSRTLTGALIRATFPCHGVASTLCALLPHAKVVSPPDGGVRGGEFFSP